MLRFLQLHVLRLDSQSTSWPWITRIFLVFNGILFCPLAGIGFADRDPSANTTLFFPFEGVRSKPNGWEQPNIVGGWLPLQHLL